ncbi:hypothetical protein GCM10010428_44120 [Actinosynnema pretiosum subsp. pretiosum]
MAALAVVTAIGIAVVIGLPESATAARGVAEATSWIAGTLTPSVLLLRWALGRSNAAPEAPPVPQPVTSSPPEDTPEALLAPQPVTPTRPEDVSARPDRVVNSVQGDVTGQVIQGGTIGSINLGGPLSHRHPDRGA